MRPSAHNLYPVIALALLAGATVWLERITRVEEPQAAATRQDDPDFIADDARILGFGDDGGQRYELVTERLSHFPDGDITRLRLPRLRMNTEGREVRLTAVEGEVSPGGERVDLSGDVQAWRSGDASRAETTFSSEQLTIWPDENRAETRAPVILTQGATRATAQGMRADNLFGQFDLSGDVRVSMPRQKRKPS